MTEEPKLPILPLKDMASRHRGLIPSIAACYLDSARVCLARHHIPPQEFMLIDDRDEYRVQIEWENPDERTQDALANTDDAKRDGAYVCALAATEFSRGWVAVKRAETRTGADYYIAPAEELIEDLENCYRLEVSGTDGDNNEIKRRVRIKVKQALEGRSNLPALAAVVGFRMRSIVIKTAEEEQ